jgi:hypothetical protein
VLMLKQKEEIILRFIKSEMKIVLKCIFRKTNSSLLVLNYIEVKICL